MFFILLSNIVLKIEDQWVPVPPIPKLVSGIISHPLKKRRILDKLLELLKIAALKYGDMKNGSDMLKVDHRQFSNVFKQNQTTMERNGNVKFESGPKKHSGPKNINVKKARKRLQETFSTLVLQLEVWHPRLVFQSLQDVEKSTDFVLS